MHVLDAQLIAKGSGLFVGWYTQPPDILLQPSPYGQCTRIGAYYQQHMCKSRCIQINLITGLCMSIFVQAN